METLRRVLRSKIHRARVTHADVEYEGSISLPPDLLAAADIAEYEAVQVWNVTTGARFETYAIKGAEGSRNISINGAAAHLAKPGHIVIVACFGYTNSADLQTHVPKLVFVDAENRIKELRTEVPGPARVAVQ